MKNALNWLALRILKATKAPIIANVAWEVIRAQSVSGAEVTILNCYQTKLDPAKSPILDSEEFA